MAVIADKCPDIQINVVDQNSYRIQEWNSLNIPIYEPGLDEIIKRCRGKNLHFRSEVEQSISEADCVFISVNTPTKITGVGAGKASDLRYLENSARQIAKAARGHTIVVEKSTLPVRSAQTIKEVLNALGDGKTFDVLSNPEFMAEGSAIEDLINPDRILIGGESPMAQASLAAVYQRWVSAEKIVTSNLWSSEMAKLAANAFLAQRVSSINSLSAFCEVTGADVYQVAEAIGRDSRIGNKFLKAGPGFGGSCFKKDILNLVYMCEQYGLTEVASYWEHVVKINEWQMDRISRVVVNKLFNTVSDKVIAIMGFAFKKDTNDLRESPAITICRNLLKEGATLNIYDPRVEQKNIERELARELSVCGGKLIYSKDSYEALNRADAGLFITDWSEFNDLSWSKIAANIRRPGWIFDTRRQFNSDLLKETGLNYWTIGR